MNKKDIRTTIGTLIAIAGICSVLIFISYYHPKVDYTKSQANEYASADTVTVIIRDDKTRQFQGAVTSSMTLLQALYTATQSGNIPFKYQLTKGDRVKDFSLNNKPSMAWHITLNGKPVDSATIANVAIKTGYVVEISTQ